MYSSKIVYPYCQSMDRYSDINLQNYFFFNSSLISINNCSVGVGPAGASGADVLATMIIGKDSYGCVDVGGSGNVKMIVKQLGSGGSTDPLDQRATAGWKALFTAVILEQLAMVRIESGVSG